MVALSEVCGNLLADCCSSAIPQDGHVLKLADGSGKQAASYLGFAVLLNMCATAGGGQRVWPAHDEPRGWALPMRRASVDGV